MSTKNKIEEHSGNLYEDLTQERVESYLKELCPNEEHNKRRMNIATGKLGAIDYFIAIKNYDNSMGKEEIEQYKKKLEKELPEGIYNIQTK